MTPARRLRAPVLSRIQPLPWATLTAVWVLLWGNLSWANVLGGLLLSAVVLLAFPLPRLRPGAQLRPWPLLQLLGHFVKDLVVASLQVAWLTVRPGPPVQGLIFPVQLRSRDEFLLTVTADIIGLIPGTVVIDLQADTGTLTVHGLEATSALDARRHRATILEQEDRVLRAFGRDLPAPEKP